MDQYHFFQTEQATVEYILGCLQKYEARYSIIPASWVQSLYTMEVEGLKKFINEETTYEWFKEVLPSVKVHSGRSLIISNFPRNFPQGINFQLIDSLEDSCAIYFIGTFASSYYKTVLNNLGLEAKDCITCQVISDPTDNGLLFQEIRQLTSTNDSGTIRKTLVEASNNLEKMAQVDPSDRYHPTYMGGILTQKR